MTDPLSRRRFLGAGGAGLALAGASMVSGRAQAASLPEAPDHDRRHDAAAALSEDRAGLSARRHAQRLDASLAHERRLEGVPPGRRTGRARARARHEGASVGLQRPVSRPDHRGGRGRQGQDLRHQQAAGEHRGALARPAPAERHGRRRRPDSAATSRPARPSSTSSSCGSPAPSCTTHTRTRWCRWRWA